MGRKSRRVALISRLNSVCHLLLQGNTTTLLRVFPFTRTSLANPWTACPSLDVFDPLPGASWSFAQRGLATTADGGSLVVSAWIANGAGNASLAQAGRVFTWARSSPSSWAPVGAPLENPGGPVPSMQFGWSVALSPDGLSLIVVLGCYGLVIGLGCQGDAYEVSEDSWEHQARGENTARE